MASWRTLFDRDDVSLKDVIFGMVIIISGRVSRLFELTGDQAADVTELIGLIGFCVWQGVRWWTKRQEEKSSFVLHEEPAS